MKRRGFLKSSLALGALATASTGLGACQTAVRPGEKARVNRAAKRLALFG